MGRFTQVDPFDGALSVPSSLNGYAYGHGNPARYTDPEGLCGPLCWAAIAVGLVGLGVFAWDYGSQVNYNMQQGMDFGTAVNPANVNWQHSAMYGLLAAGATAGIICYLNPVCALAAASVLSTVGPYAEAAFYAAGITMAVSRLPGASRLGLTPASDEEMMDWAALYMVGLQSAPFPATRARIRANKTTTALTVYNAEEAALSKAISEGNWAYFAPNFYVTRGGVAIPRHIIQAYGFDASMNLANALSGGRLASEQELLYEVLARMRYISKPQGVSLDQAFLDNFATYLHHRGGIGGAKLRDGVISILEAEGQWYVGFSGMPKELGGSRSLETSISAHFSRITSQPPVYYGEFHAETNALSEYAAFSGSGGGGQASMAVNRNPCVYCIPPGDPSTGNMWKAVQGAHVTQLEIFGPTIYWRLPWYVP